MVSRSLAYLSTASNQEKTTYAPTPWRQGEWQVQNIDLEDMPPGLVEAEKALACVKKDLKHKS